MTTSSTDQTRALDLEADAARYPDERGEILLEAAAAWERAGELDRARSVLTEVLALGGEDAGFARHGLAEICFDEGADADAWAQLRALEQAGPVAAGPAVLVAEMLERRGDYEAALGWFERALGPDTAALAAAVEQREAPSMSDMPLYGRQRCRAKLGLPADDLDRVADLAEQRRRDFFDLLDRAARSQPAATSGPTRVSMLVWHRDELSRAAWRWPAVFTKDNHAVLERELRRLAADHNLATVPLILGTADGLGEYLDRTGADVTEESTRLAYAEQVRARGGTITWPPGRNEPCWCGSARKYKKCCGGAGT
ncbi:MAG: SEC-C metal-binding domain-containing protein [Pseudonocardia sp.]